MWTEIVHSGTQYSLRLKTILKEIYYSIYDFDQNIIPLIVNYTNDIITYVLDDYKLKWKGVYSHGIVDDLDNVHLWLTKKGGYSFHFQKFDFCGAQTSESQEKMDIKFATDISTFPYCEENAMYHYSISDLRSHILSSKKDYNNDVLSSIEGLYENCSRELVSDNSFYCAMESSCYRYWEELNWFFIRDYKSLCEEISFIIKLLPKTWCDDDNLDGDD